MSDERLLAILCNWLRQYRRRTAVELSGREKELNREPDSLKLRNQVAEKKRELGLVTEDSIEKYQTFWISLGPHARRPCPLCFVHGTTSNLYPLPEENREESVKCEGCKERFFFPPGSA